MNMKTLQISRLIVITRADLAPGYQIAQSGHAIAQFFLEYPEQAKQWNNNYLISLSVSNEQKLQQLLIKIGETGTDVSYFTEPDINDELTSICFIENEKTSRFISKLPLSLSHEMDRKTA